MKKKYAIFTVIIFILLVTTFTYFNTLKQNNIYKENIENNQTKITKGISMNLEQTAGAGDYKTVTQSGWPTEGYKFNTELSRCENGSELSWDDTNKKVIVSGNLSDKCYVYFDIYVPLTLAEYIISNYTGIQGNNALYYHDSSLTNGAGDNSYRYSGGDYVLTDAGKATGATVMVGGNNVTTTLIDYYCNGTKQYVGPTSCSTSQTHYYLIKGDTTQYQTYNETLNKAVEKGYLTKDNVKNFVCFGSDANVCPTENLYRIIGVIDGKVKLKKYDYATSVLLGTDEDYYGSTYSNDKSGYRGSLKTINHYYWNYATQTNTWSESVLNKTNLNTNFINNIGSAWANKIAKTVWKVGGNTKENIMSSVPSTAYQNEIGSNASSTTYEAKIGLLYVSDYGYAASPDVWNLIMNSYNDANAKSTNWMYLGEAEWTITRVSSDNGYAFYVAGDGIVNYNDVEEVGYGILPVFNLNSDVTYVSGTGTQSDPIRIN